MCFKYREKKYGKFTLILVSLLLMALAVGFVYGGVYALLKMVHWAKWIILAVGIILAIPCLIFGGIMFTVSLSMTGRNKSVRDVNSGKGIADTRLCDKCGRVISKKAEYCEHCGTKQVSGLGMKTCPYCKTKNSGAAEFCEKCGKSLKETSEE